RPVLAVDRNHVGVAREDVAGHGGIADRRDQVGLGTGLVGPPRVGTPEAIEIALDPADQREVRVAACRVEADEAFQDRNRARDVHLQPALPPRADQRAWATPAATLA